MPGGMPYAMDKGPYLSIVEDFLNGNRRRAVGALEQLRRGVPIVELGALDGPFGGGPYTPEELQKHVAEDWFGLQLQFDAANKVVGYQPQPDFHDQANTHTGFWAHWYGDAEGVFRQTFIRALEVSLGLDHGAATAPERSRTPPQHWDVSIFWNCPHPWYEGWVCWKQHDDTPRGGQVTVVINTPAHHPLPRSERQGTAKATHQSGELFNSPIVAPPFDAASFPPYEVDPQSSDGANGVWVVSQVYHHEWTPSTSNTAPAGTWRPPTLGRPVRSVGPVVTVAIAEAHGGVLPGGRRYQPTP